METYQIRFHSVGMIKIIDGRFLPDPSQPVSQALGVVPFKGGPGRLRIGCNIDTWVVNEATVFRGGNSGQSPLLQALLGRPSALQAGSPVNKSSASQGKSGYTQLAAGTGPAYIRFVFTFPDNATAGRGQFISPLYIVIRASDFPPNAAGEAMTGVMIGDISHYARQIAGQKGSLVVSVATDHNVTSWGYFFAGLEQSVTPGGAASYVAMEAASYDFIVPVMAPLQSVSYQDMPGRIFGIDTSVAGQPAQE
jgi:hypothetical protein